MKKEAGLQGIFNEIIKENSPYFLNVRAENPNRLDEKWPSSQHIIIKLLFIEHNEGSDNE